MAGLKTEKEIHTKLVELAKELVDTEGSQAHGIRCQLKILKWVLGE